MKRKILIAFLSILLIFVCVFSFVACDKNSGDGKDNGENSNSGFNSGNDKTVSVSGTYYEVYNDEIDEDTYMQFKNGTWTDDGGVNGAFTLDGNKLTLFLTIDGEKEEYMSGRVNGDDIKFDDDTLYRKGEDITEKPKRLDFALSEDKSYYIVKGIGGLSGDIVVPEAYKQKPVKEIAEKAFANKYALTSIEIPTTVDTIGQRAFFNCQSLTSVKILGDIQLIERETFRDCKSLESITIPVVNEIHSDAFKDCGRDIEVYFLGTIAQWCNIDFADGPDGEYASNPITRIYDGDDKSLYVDEKLVENVIIDADEVKPNAFREYGKLKSVTMTSNVTEVGAGAFYRCDLLASVDMKDSNVTSIGKEAFYNNPQLSSVTFSQSLEYVGVSAFEDCKKLQAVELGDSMEEIGESAFDWCESLKTLSLGNSIMTIGRRAFTGGGYTQITIPASVIFIGGFAFSSNSLTSATFERKSGWKVDNTSTLANIKELEESWLNNPATMANYLKNNGYPQIAVYDWYVDTLIYTLSKDGTYYSVKNKGPITQSTIVIPEKYNNIPVKSIESDAFYNCSRLTSIEIPSSVTSIGSNAFSYCSRLTSITIPSSVTSIGSSAFYNCSRLTSIEIPSGVTSIGNSAFSGCGSLVIYCEAESKPSGWNSSWNWRCPEVWNCKNNDVATDGYIYYVDNYGIKYALKDGVVTVLRQSDAISGDIVILGQITYKGTTYNVTIGSSAFSGCSSLTSVVISSGVTSIGDGAFTNCSSLTSIKIPSSVTSIDYGAFEKCISLTSVVISSGVTSIGANAFCSCISLTSIVIPSGVTSIGANAFNNCSSLTSIVIPSSVTSIDAYAFWHCSSLTSIVIPSSVTSIGLMVFNNCSNLTIYCEAESRLSGWDSSWNSNRPVVWGYKQR